MSHITHSRLLWGNGCPAVRGLLIALMLLMLVGARSAQASTINVPADYPTIQSAIDAASDGDTVEVAAGTYTGTGNVDLTLNKSITVEGSAGASSTIINCQGTSSDNHRGFLINGGTATVRGFTIENGYEGALGGGIAVAVAGTSPTITQCVFTDCDSQSGGGIWVNTSTDTNATTITQCVITNCGNSSTTGGGIYIQQASIVCTDCVFAGNFSSYGGGIIVHFDSTATVTNCSFTANSATFGGGIFVYQQDSPDTSSVTLTNCLLYGNSASVGSDLSVYGAVSASLSHSDVGNIVNISGTVSDDGTNISTNPLFVSPSSPYDLHLQAGSLALGLGTSSAIDFPTTDLDGNAWATLPAAGAYQASMASTRTALGLTSGSNPSAVGASLTFTATVSNTSNSITPTGSVQFFVDGSTTPAATVSLNGSAQATYSTSSLAAGQHTISASFVTNSRFSASSSTTLNQLVIGPATHFTVSAQSSTTAGTAVNVTVTAYDTNNNVATGYTGTVNFTSSDAQAVLPANATLTNGVGTFSVTLKTAGSQFVTATDTVTSAITGTTNVAVSPAAALQLSVSAPSTATVGISIPVTVTTLDAFGNAVTSYSGSGTLTSSDPRAILPSSLSFTNGSASANVTFNTAGSQSLNASFGGLSGSTSVAVSSAANGTPKIAIGGVSLSRSGSNVTVQFTLTNSGNGEADNVHMTLAKLAGISASSLPAGVTLGAGQVTTISLTFPGVASGSQTLQLTGAYTAASTSTAGSFTSTSKVNVP